MRAMIVASVCIGCWIGLGFSQVASTSPRSDEPPATIPAGSPLRTIVDAWSLAWLPGKEKEAMDQYHLENEEERKELRFAIEYVTSFKALLDAIQNEFPEAATSKPEDLVKAAQEVMEHAELEMKGNTATVVTGAQGEIKLVRENEQWKIDFGKSTGPILPTGISRQQVSHLKQLTPMLREVRALVEAKKYKTHADALADVGKRLNELIGGGPPGQQDKALTADAVAELRKLNTALKTFEIMEGWLPATEEGLAALEPKRVDVAPGGEKAQTTGYIRSVPKDPWGHPYVYRRSAIDTSKFELFSTGPDGKEGTDDDIR